MKVPYDGATWRVTRRWVPWRRRARGASKVWDLVPSVPGGGDDIVSLIIMIIFAPVILVALLLTIVAAIEFAVLFALVPFLALGRILFGRHWIIEVRRGFEPYYEMHAGDWKQSGERIHRIAEAIARGDLPPHTLGEGAAAD